MVKKSLKRVLVYLLLFTMLLNLGFYSEYGNFGLKVGVQAQAAVTTSDKWVKIEACEYHTLALKEDGTVWAWGNNNSGQLGDGTTTDKSLPVQVSGLSGVTAIAGGGFHSLALKNDGTVWAWGANYCGQLGDGTTAQRTTPVQVGGISGVTTIAGGYNHNLALNNDGTVWAWGSNGSGQLGDGTTTNKSLPVQVSGLSGVTAIAGGANHSLAIKNNGTVWAWGWNVYGQLGDGTTAQRSIPVQVIGISGVTSIAGGNDQSLVLKNDGTVWAWGANWSGKLGDGTTTNRSTPVQVSGLSGVTSIASGGYHSLAIKNGGTVWAWGYNYYGQLGDGTTTNKSLPVQVTGISGVIALAGRGSRSLAIKNDCTLWEWGINNFGPYGNGTATNRSLPVKVSGLSGVIAIAGGNSHSIALKTGGTVWAWGYNYSGQLGDGTTTDKSLPVQVAGLSRVTAVAVGNSHSLALKNDGTVWAWGYNSEGQLGDGTTTDKSLPVQVTGISGVTAIAVGNSHSLALKNDGTVWAWGYNYFGQLGDGTTTNKSLPVQVTGISGVTAIAGGDYHSLTLKNDGTVWAWGYNEYGHLGDGTTTNKSLPVQVTGLSGVTVIAGGAYHSLALKNDGTMWAWGYNYYGQLGDGTKAQRITPVQVTDLIRVTAIAVGGSHNLALKNDGTVWAWGYNGYGQLGDGTTAQRITPVQVTGISGVTAIEGGGSHSFALKNKGDIWAFGSDSEGRLGDGIVVKIPSPITFGNPISPQNISTSATTNSINLTWNSIAEGASYQVEIDGVQSQEVITTTSYTHSALSPNTRHTYRVRAKINVGFGEWSEPVFASTLSIPAPSNIMVTQKTGTSVALSWSAAQGALEYIVQADGVERSVGTKTTFKHTGLLPNTQHTYRVRFKTSLGLSEWSSIIPVITEANIPGGVLGITAYPDKTSITFVWDKVQDAQKYLVEFDGDKVDNGTGTNCVRYGLQPNTPHTFRLKAVNSLGEGIWSAPVTANTFPLDIPSNFTAVESTNNVSLSWNAVEGAQQYALEINGGAPVTVIGTTYQHTGLAPESLNNYRIRSVSPQGISAWSDGVTVMTLPVKPDVPQNVLALAGADCVTLVWNTVAGAVGYDVELDNVVIDLDANSFVIDNTNKMKYVHEELLPYTSHSYRVRAKNAAIEGEWSAPVSIKTLPGKPEAPKDISIFTSSTSAKIVWTPENGALGYNIEIYDGTNITVVNNITKNEYTHRRAATGKEYTYRISTKNILGTSQWSGYIINNSIRAACTKGRNIDLGLTATDIVDFSRYTLTVTYNPNVLEVTDLSTLSTQKETKEGKIAGTDITITAFTPGKITFVTNKAVTLGESWTGVVNSIEFKAKVSGGTHIAYSVVSKAEESE